MRGHGEHHCSLCRDPNAGGLRAGDQDWNSEVTCCVSLQRTSSEHFGITQITAKSKEKINTWWPCLPRASIQKDRHQNKERSAHREEWGPGTKAGSSLWGNRRSIC